MLQAMTLDRLKDTVLTICSVTLPTVSRQKGFSKTQFFEKLSHPTVICTLQALEAENGGFYGTATTSTTHYTQSGTLADCTLKLSLCLPRNTTLDGEQLLQSLASRLATAEEGDFYKLTLSDTTFSTTNQCFVTNLTVQCRILLLQQIETVSIAEVKVEATHTKGAD